jgi:hypothetical protein
MSKDQKQPIEQTKTCSKCKEVKLHSAFSPHAATSDGLQSWCKTCNSIAMRERYRMMRDAYVLVQKMNKETK